MAGTHVDSQLAGRLAIVPTEDGRNVNGIAHVTLRRQPVLAIVILGFTIAGRQLAIAAVVMAVVVVGGWWLFLRRRR